MTKETTQIGADPKLRPPRHAIAAIGDLSRPPSVVRHPLADSSSTIPPTSPATRTLRWFRSKAVNSSAANQLSVPPNRVNRAPSGIRLPAASPHQSAPAAHWLQRSSRL